MPRGGQQYNVICICKDVNSNAANVTTNSAGGDHNQQWTNISCKQVQRQNATLLGTITYTKWARLSIQPDNTGLLMRIPK